MSSGPGALELVAVVMVVVVICGSCGSSASSTPAVAASSPTLPKAMCDAPVKLSWASGEHDIKEAKGAQERLGRNCQRLASKIFDKKNKKAKIL